MLQIKKRLKEAKRSGSHRVLMTLIAASVIFSIPVIALVDRVQREEIIANSAKVRSSESTLTSDYPIESDRANGSPSPSRSSREKRARELANLLLSEN